MKVGFIGTGSMGSLLIDAFIASGALQPEELYASNRTLGKLAQLVERHPGLHVCDSNIETATTCDLLFLCVKPLQFKKLTDEIRAYMNPHQIVVSITSPVQIYHLEKTLPCKIAKMIPSITHRVESGTCLCMYGDRIKEEDRKLLEHLLSSISKPIEIKESHARITSDFSSCGPAFLSFFLEQWIDAAVKITGTPRQELTCMASEMLLGTGMLLTQGGFSPKQLQGRVAVPGGITAEALALLNHSLSGVFEQLINTTHAKYEEDLHKCDELFSEAP
ncbi:late competence protein ComER [Paenibacillus pini]|uniref:Pyrroline-5-carboxylate reductase n=1 Tax=Paenibacillus pini JCM 16418 TaxID=1236976 RepID=W7YX61_9BACL|nr:late competence protein ComER [Paenibacillus pini]GAF06984.1 late competence protein ComER [Paenibacillus pini JCM 16418]